MAEDKITHDMISDGDPFIKVTEGAERAESATRSLLEAVKQITKETVKGIGGDPKTIKNLKDDTEAIRKLNAAYEAHNLLLKKQKQLQDFINAKREEAAARIILAEQKVADAISKTASTEKIANEKIRQEVEKTTRIKTAAANKDKAEQEVVEQQKLKTALAALKLTDAEKRSAEAAQRSADKAKKQSDAYGQLSKRHQELKREAQNLAVAFGAESKQAIAAANAANKLDKQLKAIDEKMGDHKRSVGNYASALKGMGSQLLGAFGISFGAAAVVNGLKSSVTAFVEAEKNARALEFALKNVAGEGTAAFKTLIDQSEELQANGGVFSDDEIQKAQLQLVNYGLLSDEVTALMPKILDLATATGQDLGSATDTVIKGMNGQVKGLKMVGLEFKDTGSKAENYSIILDKLTKFEGAAADAATTTEGKYLVLMNRIDDLQEGIGEFLVEAGTGFIDWLDVVSGKTTIAEQDINRLTSALNAAARDRNETLYREIADMDKEQQARRIKLEEEMFAIKLQNAKNELDASILSKDDDRMEVAVATIKALELQRASWQLFKQDIDSFKSNSGKSFDDRTGDGEGRVEKVKKENDDIQWEMDRLGDELYQQQVELNAKQDKLEADHLKHRHKLWLEDQERKKRREYEEYMRRKMLRDAERAEEKKKFDDMIKFEERMIGAIDEGLEQRYNKREDELNREGDMIDEQLRIQSERQLQGLDNTYSEVLKMKEENDAKLVALEEARQKKEEARDLAEVFIELVKANAKDGDAKDAAMKALAQTIAIKALSNTIAGNFAEGVENFKGKGGPKDDANIIGFSSGESVVTAKGTADTAGLVTAVNEKGKAGAIDWAMDQIYKPQFAASLQPEDIRGAKPQQDWAASLLLNELVSVNEQLKELPRKGWGYDETEKYFYSTEKKNGKTTKTIKRRF